MHTERENVQTIFSVNLTSNKSCMNERRRPTETHVRTRVCLATKTQHVAMQHRQGVCGGESHALNVKYQSRAHPAPDRGSRHGPQRESLQSAVTRRFRQLERGRCPSTSHLYIPMNTKRCSTARRWPQRPR